MLITLDPEYGIYPMKLLARMDIADQRLTHHLAGRSAERTLTRGSFG
jgi:hypothetical protein